MTMLVDGADGALWLKIDDNDVVDDDDGDASNDDDGQDGDVFIYAFYIYIRVDVRDGENSQGGAEWGDWLIWFLTVTSQKRSAVVHAQQMAVA